MWDDEKVEKLKKLWAEGHTASQVAGALGGVTRNAVLGKAHRLGIAESAPRKLAKDRAAQQMRRHHQKSKRKPAPQPQRLVVKPSWFRPDYVYDPVAPAIEIEVPLAERRKLADIDDHQCRWPIGDPQDAEFHFCNQKKVDGISYCETHAKRAFKPPIPATQRATGGGVGFSWRPGAGAPQTPATGQPRRTEDVS